MVYRALFIHTPFTWRIAVVKYVFSDDKTWCEEIGLIFDQNFRPTSGGSRRFVVPPEWGIIEERRPWGSGPTGGYYTRLVLARPDGVRFIASPGDCYSRPAIRRL